MTARPRRYRADWVVPIGRPPVRDGAVLVGAGGRILEVGPAAAVPLPEDGIARDFGAAAILPGLVNAHTHLELTGLDGQVDDGEFPAWILHLMTLKRTRTADEVVAAARRGVEDCWRGGVTTVADTGDSGAVIQALAELGGSGIAYHEVFGPDPALVQESFGAWARRLDELGRFDSGRVRLGVSPHAPYTVSGPLYRRVAAHARGAGLPLAMHIAESPDESALVMRGAGGFAARWRERGIAPDPCGVTPIAWLDRHGVLGPDALCIHCVQVSADDLGLLAARGAAVAHCPRSNRRHRHGDAPLAAVRAAGIRVGAGTDSVASVAPLDLWSEARLARELGGLSAWETLDLVTRGAADAIGLGAEVGILQPGRWGDLAIVAVPPRLDERRLPDILASLGPGHVRCTVLGGREVWLAPIPPGSPLGLNPGLSSP